MFSCPVINIDIFKWALNVNFASKLFHLIHFKIYQLLWNDFNDFKIMKIILQKKRKNYRRGLKFLNFSKNQYFKYTKEQDTGFEKSVQLRTFKQPLVKAIIFLQYKTLISSLVYLPNLDNAISSSSAADRQCLSD